MLQQTVSKSKDSADATEQLSSEVEPIENEPIEEGEAQALRPLRGLAVAIVLSAPVWVGLGAAALALVSW